MRISQFLARLRAGVPPPLPVRCGTLLADLTPEEVTRVARAWRSAEERFIEWVERLPAPG